MTSTQQNEIPVDSSFGQCEIKIEHPAASCCVIPRGNTVPEERLLDVTRLDPKIKHSTIFSWFDELKPEESMTILNDHDPKPLYYQFLSRLGATFNWEYLQEGPQWWKVKISKRKEGEQTVGEIAAKDLRKAEAFRKLGIDFCCGGRDTIEQASKKSGISIKEIKEALDQAIVEPGNKADLSFSNWDVSFLADYIYNQHHKYYYDKKEPILDLTNKVAIAHGSTDTKFLALKTIVGKLFNELDNHFYKEEAVLFPYIKQLSDAKKNGNVPKTIISIGNGPLAMMEIEHEDAGNILKEIRNATENFQEPENACNTLRLLYKSLQDLEIDLHTHIHLENNILFPGALQLEKQFN